MMDVTLHPAPRWRDVVLEQIRIAGLSLRREALVVAAVLGFGTVLIVADLIVGKPGFDSDETFPTAWIFFLLPFAVWRGEKRFGPAYLWTLPVERRRMALTKVFAGGVWLMAALAFFLSWLLGLGLLAGVSSEYTIARVPVIATIAAYLFGSAMVVGLRHPVRWLAGGAGMLYLLANGVDPDDVRTVLNSSELALHWLRLPPLARWAITTFLSLGAGLAALWAAASRHGERRRH